jgi:hypothetical protein
VRPIALLGLLALVLVPSCRKDGCDEDYELTPRGFKIQIPPLQNPTISREEVMLWLEMRIDQWVNSHSEHAKDYLYGIAYEYVYVIYDFWAFRVPTLQSSSGMAAGRFQKGCKIEAALYQKGKQPDDPRLVPPPTGIPPEHTIMWGADIARWTGVSAWDTGNWYYGYIPIENEVKIGMPVIPHELDHAIGIHHGYE